jgi:hypothetical protein
MTKDTNKEWEKEFDSAFNWIEEEKERCEIMYGFTSEILKAFITKAIDQARAAERAALREKIEELFSQPHLDPDYGDHAPSDCRSCIYKDTLRLVLTLLDNHD